MTRWAMCLLCLLVLGAATAQADYENCLFFSEYCEGSSFNKAIEIYNATEGDVDLSTLEIVLFSNGSPTPTATAVLPSVVLPKGGTFVVCHPSADPALQAVAGLLSTVVNFNGDDAFALRGAGGGAFFDVIGQIGFDPGSAWGLGDVTTVDHTLRRSISICCGDAIGSDPFDPTLEWVSFAVNTFSGFGGHVADCIAVPVTEETWGTIKGLYR